MSRKESSGYSGEALQVLTEANAEIGDKICVSKKGKAYEGILIPRSEYSDEKHVVIKLKSGYNVGIRVGTDTDRKSTRLNSSHTT
jgi:glutamyl-tRNA(Gln) amidotransferase subunit D